MSESPPENPHQPPRDVHEPQYSTRVDIRFSLLIKQLLWVLNTDRDAQWIITSKGARRSTGKTTLGVILARLVHSFTRCENCGFYWIPEVWMTDETRHCPRCAAYDEWENPFPEWDAEEFGYVDPDRMKYKYESVEKKAFVLDEAEAAADKRRAMSGQNVRLARLITMLRVQNNITFLTLPTTRMLDDRVVMLTDGLIHTVKRGKAYTYSFEWHDFEQYTFNKRHVYPISKIVDNAEFRETVYWSDLHARDRDMRILKEKKRSYVTGSMRDKDRERMSEMREEAEREVEVMVTEQLIDRTDMSLADIADIMDVSSGQASNINRGKLDVQDESDEKYPIRE